MYVWVVQVDLEISEAVQWGKAFHETMWRCSTACQMEEKELEGQEEKEKELEGEREKEKTEGEAMRRANSSNTRRTCRRINLRQLRWRSRRRSHCRIHHWSHHPR